MKTVRRFVPAHKKAAVLSERLEKYGESYFLFIEQPLLLKAESLWMGHSTKIALKHYIMLEDNEHAIAIGRKVTQAVNEADPVLLSEETEVKKRYF